MSSSRSGLPWKTFTVRIIVPVAMAIALYIGAFFLITIPIIENNSMERKREMIRELTNSAWNILAKFEYDESKGILTREDAQRMAIEQIANLHYGQGMKDYFWINDMHPRMILHPYRKDLIGKDLSDYTDPDGKKVFMQFVSIVQQEGAGFVTYRWQWMDNKNRILPKISYVKGFAPWGWIIGTGIYFDDVKNEIGSLRMHLAKISLFILAVITVLLGSIIKQTYTTMHLQKKAEEALRESEAKFRTLVESAAEGMLMAVGGKLIYVNHTIADLLEYTIAELNGMQVHAILPADDVNGQAHIRNLMSGIHAPERFETRFIAKSGEYRDVILSSTAISLNGQDGFMAVVTDITTRKQIENALNASEKKFRSIANNLNVAIFRRTVGDVPKFIEVNPALVRLFGYESRNELINKSLVDLLAESDSKMIFNQKLSSNPGKGSLVSMIRKDGSRFIASIREAEIAEPGSKLDYRDGIVEDVTGLVERENEYKRDFSEMQAAISFFNRSLGTLPVNLPAVCEYGTPISAAMECMNQQQADLLLVTDHTGKPAGVIANRDFRKIKSMQGVDLSMAVDHIMTAPVKHLPVTASVFEAWECMQKNAISHLFISDRDNRITGVLHIKDIVPMRTCSPGVLLEEIGRAPNAEALVELSRTLPYHTVLFVENGITPRRINHFTSVIGDAISVRCIELALEQLGPPPAAFSFIVFGSVGRQEQTLYTDQDNAIIYDNPIPSMVSEVHSYFLALGDNVCAMLNAAGYSFCKGGNMANNPKWCRSLSEWIEYFTTWTSTAEAQDLLNVKIFFDFRHVYGNGNLSAMLRAHLNKLLPDNHRFFQLLTRNVLPWTPPIGFFGNFLVETTDDNRKVIDMKSAMMPIVDYARIFALQHAIGTTNTLDRLDILGERSIISHLTHKEIVQAYEYCMQIRFKIQAQAIASGNKEPDNYIDPKDLTNIERKLLREIFTQIRNFQTGLSYEFTGQAGVI